MRLVCGIDSSTQSTKVTLRDLDTGAEVAAGRAPHPPTTPPVSEQVPRAWWDALVAACAQVADHLVDVVAVAVAGQQHGLVLTDEAGEPLRPAMLWNDTTSAPHAAELTARLGAAWWAREVGVVPVAAITVTKVARLAADEPDVLARARAIALPHDWLTRRLCGAHVTDRGDASGTGWWSAGRGRLELGGLEAIDPARDWAPLLPRVLGATEAAGRVSAAAAAATGLPEGALVGPGTGDNMAAALGLGLRTGDVAVSLGTSGTVFAVSDHPVADPSGLVAGFADATGRFLPLVCTLNATKVTDALAGWLGVGAVELALLALDGRPDPDDPVLVPYLDGERSPDLPLATGLLTGLRTSTSRAQLARAAHVGVVAGLLDGLDALRRVGVDTGGFLRLVGGGAHSPAYRQLLADLAGHPVLVPELDEAVAAGAAVQAAAVAGGDDPTEVAERWLLGTGDAVDPRPEVDAAGVLAAYRRAADAAATMGRPDERE